MKLSKYLLAFLVLISVQKLSAQVNFKDSQELDLRIRQFITDTSTYSYYDPDDSNKLKLGKIDRIGAFNRQCKLTYSAQIEDTIAKFKKNSTIYKYHTYMVPVDEYGLWDFENVEGGGGSQYYFENERCKKRPMVIYNWRIDMFPGLIYVEVITGHNNCLF